MALKASGRGIYFTRRQYGFSLRDTQDTFYNRNRRRRLLGPPLPVDPAYLGPPVEVADEGTSFTIPAKRPPRRVPLPPINPDGTAMGHGGLIYGDWGGYVGPRLPPDDMSASAIPDPSQAGTLAPGAVAPAGKGFSLGDIPPIYLLGGAAAAYFFFLRKKR